MLCMSRRTFAEVMAILLWVSASALAQARPVLTIEVDKPIAKLSPMLYGLMTEEINYSYDGGLYAEMVRNRTCRARRREVPYWLLAEYGNAQAAMEIHAQTGPSEPLNYSLKLMVSQADQHHQALVLTGGYWRLTFVPHI